VAGLARFSQLRIDRAGQRYRLKFTYLAFNTTTREYHTQLMPSTASVKAAAIEPAVIARIRSSSMSSSTAAAATSVPMAVDSPFFDVDVGLPYSLAVVRQPTGAIAGGNAFAVQPVVQLRDVGGNVIASDSQSSVVASVVASPSVGRTVRIDTRRDPIVEINRIFSVPANQIVAPGDLVTIFVEFKEEVTLGATSSLPTLALNLQTAAAPSVNLEATARRSGAGRRSTVFAFDFTVPLSLKGTAGSRRGMLLEVGSPRALNLGSSSTPWGASLLDNLGRAANLTLSAICAPGGSSSLGVLGNLTVSSAAPQPISLALLVERTGQSHLPALLNVSTTTVAAEQESLEHWRPPLRRPETATITTVETFASLNATALAGLSVNVGAGHRLAIAVSFSAPVVVEGIPTIPLNFTLANHSGTHAQSTGPEDAWAVRSFVYARGSNSTSLLFTYDVQPNDALANGRALSFPDGIDAAAINLTSTMEGGKAWIRRQSDSPELAANLSLASLEPSLKQDSLALTVDTSPPRLNTTIGPFASSSVETFVTSLQPDGAYAAGDELLFAVSFDKPVAATVGCFLALETRADASNTPLRTVYVTPSGPQVSTRAPGIAALYEGNNTATLTFRYVVQPGDATEQLQEWAGAQAQGGGGSSGYSAIVVPSGESLLRLSTRPLTLADTSMIYGSGYGGQLNESAALSLDGATPVVEAIYVDGFQQLSHSGPWSIYAGDLGSFTRLDGSDPSRANVTLGAGDQLFLNVTWSAPVTLTGEPDAYHLVLDPGLGPVTRAGVYASGNGTSTLQYVYTVQLGDSFQPSVSAACEACYAYAEHGAAAVTGSVYDPTACPKPYTCPWSLGTRYSPSALSGPPPKLASTHPMLAADPSLAHLKLGDVTAGMKFGLPLRARRHTRTSDDDDVIVLDNRTSVWIDTSPGSVGGDRTTAIVDVTTTKAAGTYGAGEAVFVEVTFSDDVEVDPRLLPPRLRLNVDSNDAAAAASRSTMSGGFGPYADYYSGTGTNKFTFLYRARPGDNASSLNWAVEPTSLPTYLRAKAASLGSAVANQTNTPMYHRGSFLLCNGSLPNGGEASSSSSSSSGRCTLANRNGLAVNLTLAAAKEARGGVPLDALIGSAFNSSVGAISIDTTPPTVVRVYSTKNATRLKDSVYTVGEEIPVVVEFSAPVFLEGTPMLYLVTGPGDLDTTALPCKGFLPSPSMDRDGDGDADAELWAQAYSSGTGNNDDSAREDADHDASATWGRQLLFLYTVAPGDYSDNLSFASPAAVAAATHSRDTNALTDDAGRARIYRDASRPSGDANFDVSHLDPMLGDAKSHLALRVDTSHVPSPINVTWCQACSRISALATAWASPENAQIYGSVGTGPGGRARGGGSLYGDSADLSGVSKEATLRPGDELEFHVKFSAPVTFGPSGTSSGVAKAEVDGGKQHDLPGSLDVSSPHAIDYYRTLPFLWLECGAVDRKATYVGGDGTDVLQFMYVVQPGDLTWHLDYVDAHSLQLGLGGGLEPGKLLHASTHPSVRVNPTLPAPGATGSLGANHALWVDGRTPFVTSTQFVLPRGDWDRSSADDDDESAHRSVHDDDGADLDRSTTTARALARGSVVSASAGRVATLATGSSVLLKVSFSGPVLIGVASNGRAPRIRVGLDGDDGRHAIARDGTVATNGGDGDGDGTSDAGDSLYRYGAYGSRYSTGAEGAANYVPSSGTSAAAGGVSPGGAVAVRWFEYVNGTNSSEVWFEYKVRTGDVCLNRLDYRADERQFRSSVSSFNVDPPRGVWVRAASFHPLLDADLHLNPAGGALKPRPEGRISTETEAAAALERLSKGSLETRPEGSTTSIALALGVGTFEDLGIVQRGPDYRVRFEVLPFEAPLRFLRSVSTDLNVEYSAEYEVEAHDREVSDSLGSSVAVAGDLVASGAPRKHRDVPEIQYVRTHADAGRAVYEIQVIGVAANRQEEVQRFVTAAAPHATVGGSFKLSYASSDGIVSGETIAILHDAPPESVRVAIEQAVPQLGTIRVSKTPYTWCACVGGFEWTVTFEVATGDVQKLEVDGSALTGTGAYVSEVEVVQESPWLNGTFRLAFSTEHGGDYHYLHPRGDLYNNTDPSLAPLGARAYLSQSSSRSHYYLNGTAAAASGDDYYGGSGVVWTRPIPVDASPALVKEALEGDLGASVHSVEISQVDDANGHQYIVTFAHQVNGPALGQCLDFHNATSDGGGGASVNSNSSHCVDNDLPQLIGDPRKVGGYGSGKSADVWVHTARNGSNPVWGTFTLGFREKSARLVGPGYGLHGALRTPPLPYDISAKGLEAALEGLGGIEDVDVSKEPPRMDRGALWAITFREVRKLTPYGWVFDHMSNLEPLMAHDEKLHGTGARVEVGHRSGGASDYPHWAPKREGSFGEESGAAYVYQRVGLTRDQYQEIAKVTPADAAPYDHFGWSVSLSGGGRPWAEPQGSTVETGLGSTASGRRPLLVVGSPSKDDKGVLEQQALSCSADGGFFVLQYRGFSSDPIPWNVTHLELVEHMRGRFGPCLGCHAGATADPMHVFPAIAIDPWDVIDDADDDDAVVRDGGRRGLCNPTGYAVGRSGNATRALITFLTPPPKPGMDGDLEMLQFDATHLEWRGEVGAGNITIQEVRKGSAVPSGPEAEGAQKGAVYVFSSRDDDDHGLAAQWAQHAKLVLPSGGEADRFGWAVSIATDGLTLVVSAPGEGGDIGAAYVYQRPSAEHRDPPRDAAWGPGNWVQTQRLDGRVFSSELLDRFGESLAVSPDGNTIIVGSPGFDSGRGCAYVFLRNPYSGKFLIHQQLTLDQAQLTANDGSKSGLEERVGRIGDRLGCSVAVDVNTVVVGACGRATTTVHTGTLPSATAQPGCGAAYVFLRSTFEAYFFLSQRLVPSNHVAHDRFGFSVAVSNDTIVATSFASPPRASTSNGAGLRPRHSVQAISTALNRSATSLNIGATNGARSFDEEKVGASFTLSWRVRMLASGSWEKRTTPPLHADVSATELAAALEQYLGTGRVRVARTDADPASGGRTWFVTFAGVNDQPGWEVDGVRFGGEGAGAFNGGLTLLEADGSGLTGIGAHVEVRELNAPPAKVRGLAHVFTREVGGWASTKSGHWKPFVEQAFLYPETKQPQDLFGAAVALDGEVAMVGAPNRDSFVSYANGGAAFVYDLDFCRVAFDEDPYFVFEGHGQALGLTRQYQEDELQVLKVESLDRNAVTIKQRYARDLFGLDDAWLRSGGHGGGGAGGNGGGGSGGMGARGGGYYATVLDAVGAGSAYGRAQNYGSADPKSVWVDGAYDYRGVSDYVPVSKPVMLFADQTRVEVTLNTTNDGIVEAPDENVTVAVRLPGMWASLLGGLAAEVVIVDDADGSGNGVGNTACFEKLYGEDSEQGDSLGHSVAMDAMSGVAVAGSPRAPGREDGAVFAGAAVVYRRSTAGGVWEEEERLVPPPMVNESSFVSSGDDDALSDDGGGGYTAKMGGEGISGRGQWGVRARRATFGDAVAVGSTYGTQFGRTRSGRSITSILVGAPGEAKVYVFDYNATSAGENYNYDATEPMRRRGKWQHAATLTHPEAVYAQHRFGARGSVAIDHDIAVVGAFGLECVFMFRRVWDPSAQAFVWLPGEKLVSSDYDYDLILDRPYMHAQHFGVSLALSGRTLAVGAPFADYGNRGDKTIREPFATDGLYNPGIGRGRAYVFYSVPSQQHVSLRSDTQLYAGTFRLALENHRNLSDVTASLSYSSSPSDVKTALEKLSNIDEVEVSFELLDEGLLRQWTVSFVGENEDPPLFTPLWGQTTSTAAGFSGGSSLARSGGCDKAQCVNMSAPYSPAPRRQLLVTRRNSVGDWLEHAAVQAADKNSADAFGAAIALDGDQLIVGAPQSDARTTTTWDFETGDLVGWQRTGGTAFDMQPTYGDNPRGRSVYAEVGDRRNDGWAQQAGLEGRYYIGTFEARPGNGAKGDYASPHPDIPLGSSQGDVPTGVLTSEPFTVAGPGGITFLVGGGCDKTKVYVEFLIDGASVDRATGKCEERMQEAFFDTSLFVGRAGQVRIVDASSGPWGHINVDRFRFSWELDPSRSGPGSGTGSSGGGGQVTGYTTSDSGGAPNSRRPGNATLSGEEIPGYQAMGAGGAGRAKVHRSLQASAPEAGAAYAFRRKAAHAPTTTPSSGGQGYASSLSPSASPTSTAIESCTGDREHCMWVQEARLMASDRRAGDKFGSSVAVDDATGTCAVGAPQASGAWSLLGKAAPPNHPYYEGRGSAEVELPMDGAAAAAAMRAPNSHSPLLGSFAAVSAQRAAATAAIASASARASSSMQYSMGLNAERRAAEATAAAAEVGAGGQSSASVPIPSQPGFDPAYAYDPHAFDPREFEGSGAAYVFSRLPAVRSGGTGLPYWESPAGVPRGSAQPSFEGERGCTGATVEPPLWPLTEQMRIVPPTLAARDGLGSSVALQGWAGLFGLPGDDGVGQNAGAAVVADLAVSRCYFDSAEYVAVEGEGGGRVVITVSRDPRFSARALSIAYATSDLTARGVDTLRYAECLDLPLAERAGCGDYLQTAGEATFAPGDASVNFVVYVMNDLCHEHHPEYVLLTLSVPGGGPLGGEDYISRIRIDDDDLNRPPCELS